MAYVQFAAVPVKVLDGAAAVRVRSPNVSVKGAGVEAVEYITLVDVKTYVEADRKLCVVVVWLVSVTVFVACFVDVEKMTEVLI